MADLIQVKSKKGKIFNQFHVGCFKLFFVYYYISKPEKLLIA